MGIENSEGIKTGPLEAAPLRDFLANRNIREEDRVLIAELASIDSDAVARYLHNFFSAYRERSAARLAQLAGETTNPGLKTLYDGFRHIATAYDWYTANHLGGAIEQYRWKKNAYEE